MTIGPIQLFSQATPAQRRTLAAAGLGWMLDSFDAMLYALVLAHVMRDLGMTKSTAGLLKQFDAARAGIGGVLFGFIADRVGRKRALMASILTYSVCSFASGLSTPVLMLAAFRFILGLGMGGEWNTGATWSPRHGRRNFARRRSRSCRIRGPSGMRWRRWWLGWSCITRMAGVFFVGIAPAAVTLWIRRGVPESAMWEEHQRAHASVAKPGRCRFFRTAFRRPYVRYTFALLVR